MQNSKQQGAALLTALLILAICTTLATFMLLRQRLLIHQITMVNNTDKMTLALQGVQDWGIGLIKNPETLHTTHDLKKTINGMNIKGHVVSVGGQFNLNTLSNPVMVAVFSQLIQKVSGLTPVQADKISHSVNLFLVPLGSTNSDENYYLGLTPPYRPAAQLMASVSEFRLIRGVSASLYQALVLGKHSFITVLPTRSTSVDVNAVSAPVLSALANISLDAAKSIVQCRLNYGYFKDKDKFLSLCAPGDTLKQLTALTTTSHYYLVIGHAKVGDQRMVMKSLLYTDGQTNKAKVTVIWQETNGE